MHAQELLSGGEGNEPYVRNIELYIYAEEPASFFDVMARARQRAEVAIGYITDVSDAEARQVILNPADKELPRTWGPHDKIVVLAND